jgi:uncharacterized protein with von Willebrand factor type A (vWA) domain
MSLDQRPGTFEVDVAALAVAVGQRLHDADMQVTPEQSERYALSLQLTKPRTLQALYHTTRVSFVTDVDQMETFDRVFGDVFGPALATSATDHALPVRA